MTTTMLDTKGLNCPLPILRAKKAINNVEVGDILHVIATDPGSVQDFEAFCRATGHKLLESTAEDGVYGFMIERTA